MLVSPNRLRRQARFWGLFVCAVDGIISTIHAMLTLLSIKTTIHADTKPCTIYYLFRCKLESTKVHMTFVVITYYIPLMGHNISFKKKNLSSWLSSSWRPGHLNNLFTWKKAYKEQHIHLKSAYHSLLRLASLGGKSNTGCLHYILQNNEWLM